MLHSNPRCGQQLVEIFVGLVVRLVAPAAADEIDDVTEILADDEQLRASMAEPLLPMADHLGVEVEFGAAPDFARAALDADAASLARRDERLKLRHVRPMPEPARPNGEADDQRSRAVPDAVVYSRNNSGRCRG